MHDDLTAQDIEMMQKELDHRKLELMPELIEEVKRTRAFGDLSENFEYKAAKQAQNRNRSRIRYLERMIKSAHVIEDKAGADELVFLDITASSDSRNIVIDMVRKVAETVFIPFTVGGGIRTVDDFKAILREGADKISINSSAINTPRLISDAADKFGSQCVVVAIDARRREDGSGWNVFKNGGRVDTGLDAIEWAMQADKMGAGEILLTSMDCDGTKAGYDVELTRLIAENVSVPVIASGGAGTKEHFYDALTEGKADAALAASLFHYKELEIMDLKAYLAERGIPMRM